MVKAKKAVKRKAVKASRVKSRSSVRPAAKKPVKSAAKKIKAAGKNKAAKRAKSAMSAKGRTPKSPEMMLEKIGEVTHYFPHVNAAAVKLMKSGLAIGDKIYIKGHTTDFKEKVLSIQLDHESIAKGKKGQEIGLSVKSRVRIGDRIYKV